MSILTAIFILSVACLTTGP